MCLGQKIRHRRRIFIQQSFGARQLLSTQRRQGQERRRSHVEAGAPSISAALQNNSIELRFFQFRSRSER